jgi:hypothetical protein
MMKQYFLKTNRETGEVISLQPGGGNTKRKFREIRRNLAAHEKTADLFCELIKEGIKSGIKLKKQHALR